MKKDKLEELFRRMEDDFDIETPPDRHRDRFLEKLQKSKENKGSERTHRFAYLKPLLAIAASVLIIFGAVTGLLSFNQKDGLASVSPEMAKTQQFYTTAIAKELRKIEKQQTPATKRLIQDAMIQMGKLETEYTQLQKDLVKSGDDSRVIYAMISNLQKRIHILQAVLKQIDHVKQLKQKDHEHVEII